MTFENLRKSKNVKEFRKNVGPDFSYITLRSLPAVLKTDFNLTKHGVNLTNGKLIS
jgi:hypothetical protein